MLAPAEKILAKIENSENPELYAVFPYKLYGVNRPEYEMARLQLRSSESSRYGRLAAGCDLGGLPRRLRAGKRLRRRELLEQECREPLPGLLGPELRLGARPGPRLAAQIALQSMLMQTDGDKILLFPAWPKDWDVDFKLVAPKNTTSKFVYSQGEIQALKVTPAVARRRHRQAGAAVA